MIREFYNYQIQQFTSAVTANKNALLIYPPSGLQANGTAQSITLKFHPPHFMIHGLTFLVCSRIIKVYPPSGLQANNIAQSITLKFHPLHFTIQGLTFLISSRIIKVDALLFQVLISLKAVGREARRRKNYQIQQFTSAVTANKNALLISPNFRKQKRFNMM